MKVDIATLLTVLFSIHLTCIFITSGYMAEKEIKKKNKLTLEDINNIALHMIYRPMVFYTVIYVMVVMLAALILPYNIQFLKLDACDYDLLNNVIVSKFSITFIIMVIGCLYWTIASAIKGTIIDQELNKKDIEFYMRRMGMKMSFIYTIIILLIVLVAVLQLRTGIGLFIVF